tara:strand:- start:606 stop:1145 length:540 start_codon:yes stop_codon:yes gene_type:complete
MPGVHLAACCLAGRPGLYLLWLYLLWQGALIAVNFFLAFRGVQIWQLIQKVKVIQILHRVGWVAPLTQKGGRVLHGLTMPVRSLLRGVTTPGRAVASTLANRKAEELALEVAAAAAARTWRPFSAPVTTAWRRGLPVKSGLPSPAEHPPPPLPPSPPRTTMGLASSALTLLRSLLGKYS